MCLVQFRKRHLKQHDGGAQEGPRAGGDGSHACTSGRPLQRARDFGAPARVSVRPHPASTTPTLTPTTSTLPPLPTTTRRSLPTKTQPLGSSFTRTSAPIRRRSVLLAAEKHGKAKLLSRPIGVGACAAPQVMPNTDLEGMGLDTTDEWISERTGISSRHLLPEGSGLRDLASTAATRALEASGVSAEEVRTNLLGARGRWGDPLHLNANAASPPAQWMVSYFRVTFTTPARSTS